MPVIKYLWYIRKSTKQRLFNLHTRLFMSHIQPQYNKIDYYNPILASDY